MIVTNFPRKVRVIEHMPIPLKDGTTLAARIWLPEDAEQNPVPAILAGARSSMRSVRLLSHSDVAVSTGPPRVPRC